MSASGRTGYNDILSAVFIICSACLGRLLVLLAAALRTGSVGRNAGKGGGAGSICVEGIAYTADGLGGACHHNTVGRIKLVSCAVDVVETGLHLAVGSE